MLIPHVWHMYHARERWIKKKAKMHFWLSIFGSVAILATY